MQRTTTTPRELRVTTQYWRGAVRICELECAGQQLDIHVRRSTDTEWILEAHSTHSADAIIVAGSGPTRAAALLVLASAWGDKAPALGLHTFDWKAVGDLLRTVNAID